MLGVTGTSGKTTVAHLLEAGLTAAGPRTGLVGTVGTRIDGPAEPAAQRVHHARGTRPAGAVRGDGRGAASPTCAMEVSSHALALGRVAGTRFAVAAFTNLSQDHLDFHADMEDYFAAKAALFDGRAERAVICVDDEWGQRLAARHPRRGDRRHHRSGELADRRRPRRRADGGQTFTAHGPDGRRCRCCCGCRARSTSPTPCSRWPAWTRSGCRPSWPPPAFGSWTVPGRMQRIEDGQPFLAVVDYAHKPAAVAALLDALRAQVPGRLIVVLGCGGDRDRGKRPLMGAAAAARAELLVVTDDNPRGEDPAAIRAAMLAGARAAGRPRRGARDRRPARGDRRRGGRRARG